MFEKASLRPRGFELLICRVNDLKTERVISLYKDSGRSFSFVWRVLAHPQFRQRPTL